MQRAVQMMHCCDPVAIPGLDRTPIWSRTLLKSSWPSRAAVVCLAQWCSSAAPDHVAMFAALGGLLV